MTNRSIGVARIDHALASLATLIDRPAMRVGADLISDASVAELHPVEAEAVAMAVPSRRIEFASGRALLRRLIGGDIPIPMASDRKPVLPAGVAASLAHDHDVVIAVVERAPISLGVDTERVGAVASDLATIVLRPDESGLEPTLAFCAKEAAYKAWSNGGGAFLEHHDVRLTLDGARFVAEVVGNADGAGIGSTMRGAWAEVDGRVVALVAADLTPDP